MLTLAALALLCSAVLPAVAGARIKPKTGVYVRLLGPAFLFLDVSRDRSKVKYLEVSYFCGRKLTSVFVGSAPIRKVGSRSVGFDVKRRVTRPNGHVVRATLSGVWSTRKVVEGTMEVIDRDCPEPPEGQLYAPVETWSAWWDPINQPL